MKVFITGVSSFTGCHIARSFYDLTQTKKISVFATLTRKKSDYSSLECERLRYSLVDNLIEEAPFGSKNFIDNLVRLKPDVFINHGASIRGYREKNFDVKGCVSKALFNLAEVFSALPSSCRFIHSGSIFEEDLERGLKSYSPYGLAKTLIWEELLRFQKKITITKIVIPDPVGIFENLDRLGPILFKKWKLGEKIDLKNPTVVQDRIPASWLASKYVEEAFIPLAKDSFVVRVVRPSAFCQSNLDWIKNLAFYFEKKTKKKCPGWNILPNVDDERRNTEQVEKILNKEECDKFFEGYSDWLLK